TVSTGDGNGTVFTIYFPAYEGTAEEEPAEETGEVKGGSETILVVDDEAALRKLVVDALEPLGYRILAVSCGEEAVQLFQAQRDKVDLLLTDVVMPGMNGRALAESLRRADSSLKVIFMSGYADNLLQPGGREAEFLQKPLSLRTLAKKVRETLDR
ncbi:MAG: response regulator, partial [Nitrospiraceae bacterium]|nr:response regulator [Nitrospiraceae bacterium]